MKVSDGGSMTDRELLELAAKAMGWRIDFLSYEDDGLASAYDADDRQSAWNPLADDGDALRLAVKLALDILQYQDGKDSDSVEVIANDSRFDDFKPWASERLDDDSFAATRRAIVRAAAEIGRGMSDEPQTVA